MCRSGCWWRWRLTDPPPSSLWTLLILGAEPCSGFQVMHSVSDIAHATDMTHIAVQLPDVTQCSEKQKKHRHQTEEARQAWLVQLHTPGVVWLWLDGTSKAVDATVEVCTSSLLQYFSHPALA